MEAVMDQNEPKKRGRPRNEPFKLDRSRIHFIGYVADMTQRGNNWTVYIFEENQKEDAPRASFVKFTEQEAKDEAMARIKEFVEKKKNP
jgi:hypothetical protein